MNRLFQKLDHFVPLVLRIENVDTLPDGGPVFVEIDRRGIDIGRDTYLDWTLPDPDRFISGKHCEIHFRDGAYWLHDVSTNGTSVNGQPGRLTEPHRLAHGDRIHIGPYIVQTELSGVEAGPGGPGPIPDKGGTSVGGDPWGGLEGTAEAIDRRDFTAHSQAKEGAAGPVDLAEENISWGFGDVVERPASSDTPEWGGADETVTSSSASPPSDSNADWGAPVDPEGVGSGGMSPWDLPVTEATLKEPVLPDPSNVAPSYIADAPPTASSGDLGDNPFLAESSPSSEREPEPVVAEQTPAPSIPEPEPSQDSEPEPKIDVFGTLSDSQHPVEPEPAASAISNEPWADSTPPPAPNIEQPDPQVGPLRESGSSLSDGAFIASFERGAGLPVGSISGRSDEVLAEELGTLFREVTQALQSMLLARAETKSAMRSSERTMIGALENNPLKFSPTPEDAMRIMFGQKTRSYLDASQTIEQSFADLQKHQMQTFGAMQSALQVLIEDLDPENIAGATAKDGGLAGIVGSRRAKYWDTYVERFSAKSGHHDRGMIDAFMILFAEMYDRQG